MLSEKHYEKHNYTILGIGDPGEYVIENVSASLGAGAPLSFYRCKKFSDFRMKDITYTEMTKALFLVLQPGDGAGDTFIPEIESFRKRTGIPVYTIANYPFLWEGRIRIALADDLLQELLRISHATFRIESHQWFPLKEQLGFHKVVELVHDVAARVLLSIINLEAQDMDIKEMESISIDEHVEAIKQHGAYWIVKRCDPDILTRRK